MAETAETSRAIQFLKWAAPIFIVPIVLLLTNLAIDEHKEETAEKKEAIARESEMLVAPLKQEMINAKTPDDIENILSKVPQAKEVAQTAEVRNELDAFYNGGLVIKKDLEEKERVDLADKDAREEAKRSGTEDAETRAKQADEEQSRLDANLKAVYQKVLSAPHAILSVFSHK